MKTMMSLFIAFLSFINYEQVSAKDLNVVVSIAPIHSLVSSIMEGAGEPTLLFTQGNEGTTSLDPFQKSKLITADMMVWVGSGLESSMDQALNDMHMQRARLLTLSQYLPLLSPADTEDHSNMSRQQSRDLVFWTDPRLAVMAVRIITPKLVRLDPDNQELYLDNEMALIKKLKSLEAEIYAELAPYPSLHKMAAISNDRYFTHRFVAPFSMSADSDYHIRKVSTTGTNTCANIAQQNEKLTAGSELYFDAMRQLTNQVKTCLSRKGKIMASNHIDDMQITN